MGLAPTAFAFFSRVSSSFSAADAARLHAAWGLAQSAHRGQLRQSGEPYVTHPLAVAELVFDLIEPDADALCAALLHDVVEDSETSLSTIEGRFGADVANIVDGVSKLDRVGNAGTFSAKDETLRKLVAAGGRDWRVFAVKLCDRLHNMRTLGAVSFEKQRRVAAETYSVFFPLARYVGFFRVATELESLSLRSLYPRRWRVVDKWCQYKVAVDARRLRGVFQPAGCSGVEVDPGYEARVAHEMMVRGFRRLREDRACRALFSIPTTFTRCDSIAEAYKCMSELHGMFVFVPASFSSDASEGFVSTKVLVGRRGLVVECIFLFPRLARAPWVRAIGESANADDFVAVAGVVDQPGGFTRVLRELVEHSAISVFSPKGQRLSLPLHATGLDFAFAIHTDLGLRTKAIRVNGVLRDPITELSAGDIVEVIPGESVLARPEWQAALRSPRSRSKLRVWLRDIARQEAVELGRRLLSEAARMGDSEVVAAMAQHADLVQALGASSLEDVCLLIGSGRLSAYAAASVLRGAGAGALIVGASLLETRSRLLLDGQGNKGVAYCDSCKPFLGDEIIAVSSFAGTKVHRVDCPKREDGRSSNEYFVPSWASSLVRPLPVRIAVKSVDRKGLLSDCATTISNCDLNVVAVNTISRNDGLSATLEFTLLVRSKAKLDRCLSALTAVEGVRHVGRLAAAQN
jgi:GTP diphosphokinase / guanosine-3',5'-bis(diphosphate) 3'-diphosphatase